MSKFIDLTGKTFERLKVLNRVENDKFNQPAYLCECSCENKTNKIISGKCLKNGSTKSCGCLNKELVSERNSKIHKKYNSYNLTNEYGIGFTTKGEEFYFDLEDYDKIKDYCWYKDSNGYICTTRNKKLICLHRLIMDCVIKDCEVDHKNGANSRFDNRKCNLRICTHQQNLCNYPKPKRNTSGVKGVSFDKRTNSWEAHIGFKNKKIHLGRFKDFNDAVKSRKDAEIKYHNEFRYKGDETSVKKNK